MTTLSETVHAADANAFRVAARSPIVVSKATLPDRPGHTGGAPFSAKEDGTDVSFGIGVNYHFTRNLGVRAEWEMFTTDEADATLLSVGVVWRF